MPLAALQDGAHTDPGIAKAPDQGQFAALYNWRVGVDELERGTGAKKIREQRRPNNKG